MSLCKEVIIEEYIYKAVKFDAYYEIIDGKIELISTDDVINAAENGTKRSFKADGCSPQFIKMHLKRKLIPCMRRMIAHMGIKDGYIFSLASQIKIQILFSLSAASVFVEGICIIIFLSWAFTITLISLSYML